MNAWRWDWALVRSAGNEQSWHLTDLPPAIAYQNEVGQPRDERLFLSVYGLMTPDHILWKSPGPGVTRSKLAQVGIIKSRLARLVYLKIDRAARPLCWTGPDISSLHWTSVSGKHQELF
jgi:hypothetical protein